MLCTNWWTMTIFAHTFFTLRKKRCSAVKDLIFITCLSFNMQLLFCFHMDKIILHAGIEIQYTKLLKDYLKHIQNYGEYFLFSNDIFQISFWRMLNKKCRHLSFVQYQIYIIMANMFSLSTFAYLEKCYCFKRNLPMHEKNVFCITTIYLW